MMKNCLVNEEFYNKKTPPPPESGTIRSYQIKSLLETSNFSYLYIAIDKDTNRKKVLKFVKYTKNQIDQIEEEVELMKIAHHPNILQIEDSFRYGPYLCIVTPYFENRDLYYFLVKKYPKGVPEQMASKIFSQMAGAVKYLHELNICHRDIKLDNFLVTDPDPENPKIVLCDFGLAKQLSEKELLEGKCGTIEYMAPEVYFNKKYDKSADIWSLGLSLFRLLTGKLPLPSPDIIPEEFKRRLKKALLNYNAFKKIKVSENAIDLIHKMCTAKNSLRITAGDILLHPWLKSLPNNFNSESKISDVLNHDHSNPFNTGI